MQRYFAIIKDDKVILSNDDTHHVLHVMRMKKDDQIEVVDNGACYLCQIENTNPLSIKVLKKIDDEVEIKEKITLLFALSKADKIEFVIQKATELGVHRIALISTSRSIVKMSKEDFNRKLPRYLKIAKEASEQCHRNYIPEIVGIYDIRQLPKDIYSNINYVAYEKEKGDTSLTFQNIKQYSSVSILIGSEGGLSSDEITTLKDEGFVTISLGKRILRAETAAVYALSVIGYLLEK